MQPTKAPVLRVKIWKIFSTNNRESKNKGTYGRLFRRYAGLLSKVYCHGLFSDDTAFVHYRRIDESYPFDFLDAVTFVDVTKNMDIRSRSEHSSEQFFATQVKIHDATGRTMSDKHVE